ncbi:hypothetical protein MSG28_007817 [Choristoneura fumiferana]|uniref:Uncharacterized protein n=1 Tax=Choristoneura fumiferana TaxID=7141 RepID=A0ACC0JYS0_CHOFU|nr:hypothetical protein MSG28_007817 [Choristoneura fumiferana]
MFVQNDISHKPTTETNCYQNVWRRRCRTRLRTCTGSEGAARAPRCCPGEPAAGTWRLPVPCSDGPLCVTLDIIECSELTTRFARLVLSAMDFT